MHMHMHMYTCACGMLQKSTLTRKGRQINISISEDHHRPTTRHRRDPVSDPSLPLSPHGSLRFSGVVRLSRRSSTLHGRSRREATTCSVSAGHPSEPALFSRSLFAFFHALFPPSPPLSSLSKNDLLTPEWAREMAVTSPLEVGPNLMFAPNRGARVMAGFLPLSLLLCVCVCVCVC